MTTKAETPQKANEEKKVKKTRKKSEQKSKKFSLRGIKDLKKQYQLLDDEIKRLRKEADKLEKQQQIVSNELKEDRWKELTKYFSDDEMKERLQQQEN